jgi:hypothetical protein
MKRIAGITILALMFLTVVPALLAQTGTNEERGEFFFFADYTRLHHAGNANFWGPGGSVSFNLGKYAALEGGVAYDLERTVTNTFTTTSGTTTTTTTTNGGLHLFQGLFGPKFQTAIGPARVYGTVKGGFLNFGVGSGNASSFANQVGSVPSGDTNGVLYPGVGVEFGKRFGIRAEVGDLIYFDRGANHNLKFMIGPKISF